MSAYSDAVLADSPVVYYRLNETSGTLFDNLGSAGASADATANGTIDDTTGLISEDATDPATIFDYNGGTFKATTTYTVSQEPLTVEFWVAPRSLSGFSGSINWVVSCGTTGGWSCGYQHTTGAWRFTTHGVKDYDFASATAASVGVAQHVVFVLHTDHSVSIYIDGSFVETVTHGSGPGATTNVLTLATRSTSTAACNAVVDEVAIYTTDLAAARIAAHFSAATEPPVSIQTLSPSADSVDGGWTDQAGGTSLAAAIDEETFSDTDYIRSDLNPSASGCRVKLESGGDPHLSTDHVIHWRIGKIGSATINMTVKLYQGGGDVQGAGTLIASFDRNNVGSLTTYDETLSGGEADSITDYTDLYLEFFADAA